MSPLKHAATAGYEDLLGAGAAIGRGVALPGHGDERRLELLTHPLVACREQLPAHHLLYRNHLFSESCCKSAWARAA